MVGPDHGEGQPLVQAAAAFRWIAIVGQVAQDEFHAGLPLLLALREGAELLSESVARLTPEISSSMAAPAALPPTMAPSTAKDIVFQNIV